MADESQDLDRLLERLAREAEVKGDPEEHPSVETLTAYHADELSAEEKARLQEHLAACRRCAEIVLDFDEFLAEPAGGPEVVSLETAAEWRKLQKRLQEPGTPAWRRWAPALAAVLTLAVVGLYFVYQPDWSGEEREVTTLDPTGSTRGGSHAVTVPLSNDLVLRTESDEPHEEYRVEFRNLSTGEATKLSGLKEDHPSEVLIPGPQRLAPGEYEIRLWGIRDGREDSAGTYFVELQDR